MDILAYLLCVIACMISAVSLLHNVSEQFPFKQMADLAVYNIESESWFVRFMSKGAGVYQENVITASHSSDCGHSVSGRFPLKQMANVTVAADGSGNFSNVGAALAVVPKRSHRRFVIYIKAGVYHENVTVQKDQTNVVFVGDGINKTVITASNSNASGAGTLYSPTVAVYGDGFTAQDITFENSAGPSSEQAVALMCDADRSTFYRCSFTGYQDTLFARYQQQFYRECDVYGTVDFIFGDAVAVFQNCNLYARSPLHGQSNVFTAQGRAEATGGSGTVFHNCTITAAPELDKSAVRSYLGRPWEKYSRTVVMQSFLDDLIDPKGWLEWNGTFALDTLFYAEYQNRGPGANTDNRVKWPGYKLLNSSVDAQPFTVRNFIQGDLWLPSTGVPFHLDLM